MIVDIVFGFLGAGKTTFITRILQDWDDREKTVVLVNEFGEVGIDGLILAERGGNVVEMPSGCICCTLQADFKSQLLDIIHTLQPERIIIEPTGVATIAQIRAIVDAQIFENRIQRKNNILIADAVSFMELYKANRQFVTSQVQHADIVLLNKCDRVDARRAMLTRSAIASLNSAIAVLMVQFGRVDKIEYRTALATAQQFSNLSHGHITTGSFSVQIADRVVSPEPAVANVLQYESYGRTFKGVIFDPQALEQFFAHLNRPRTNLGEIVRAKGIFQVTPNALLIELASGDVSAQPTGNCDETRLAVIGRSLDRPQIDALLERCVANGVRAESTVSS